MAVEKIVNITVNNNIDKTTQDVNQLNNSLETTIQEQQQLKSSLKESSNSILENGGAMGLLNDATGGLAMTVKDAVEATGLFSKQSKIATLVQGAYATVVGASSGAMKVFRLALVSTGIGAIVVGLGLLIANFDKVKEAVLNLIPGLASVGEFFSNIIDAVTDFVGVTSDATRELDKLGEQAEKTLANNKLALDAYGDKFDEFTKRKIEANNTYAEHVKRINEDEVLSDEEKLRQLKLLRDRADRDIVQADKDRADKLAENRKKEQEKIDAEKTKREQREKEATERKKAFEAQQLKEFNEFQIALNNAAFAQRELEIEQEQERIDALNKLADKFASDEEARRLKSIADAQYEADAKKSIQDATISNIAGGIGLLKELAGKNIALQKAGIIAESALGIASIVMNTQSANAAALAPPPLGLGPIAGNALVVRNMIGAGIGIASNIAAKTKALSALGGGSAPSAGSLGSAGGSESTAPQFNIVGQSGTNQLAQTIGQNQNQPIKAYVVSGDVTTAQQLNRNAVNTASFP